jgi:hypothetical protein
MTLLQRNYSMQDPTRRFSDRASYYAKFRPTYPEELLAYLRRLFPVPAVVAERRDNLSDFAREYDDLLHRMAPDYRKSSHRRIRAEDIQGFFAPNDVTLVSFQNFQDLDLEGFNGRLLSSSYVRIVGQPGHEGIVEAAEQIFAKYEYDGKVTVEYETKLYLGRWTQR